MSKEQSVGDLLWELLSTVGRLVALCYLFYAIWTVPAQWDSGYVKNVLVCLLWLA